ncbi:hypothetical protein PENTCL1PPCAC_10006 [Pristionchus entomophagus]|uniref:Death domain-containing protein n=1 Tax=Pristionchus entomophagus TaxID=358040 RepID=A0AAV5T824_9BILA|nr:hypothetical protein PENTCL1PPCAC_10006 [Pristionchus entomophagus]
MDTPPASPSTLHAEEDAHRRLILAELDDSFSRWKQQAAAMERDVSRRIERENTERQSGLDRLAQVWLSRHGSQ